MNNAPRFEETRWPMKQKTNNAVTAWSVGEVVNYERLREEFGANSIDGALLDDLTKLAAAKGMQVHPWIKTQLYYCHRGLEEFLAAYRQDPASVFIIFRDHGQ